MAQKVGSPGCLKTGRVVGKALLGMVILAAALTGCGGGGFMPGGPHAMNQARLGSLVATYAASEHIPSRLVSAVIKAESGGDPSAVSRTGAQGLMQLMPATSAMLGVGNPFDPESNVAGGTRYLRYLLGHYRNNVQLAVAAYNAGPGAVDAFHGIPPFAETRAYVARVMAAYQTN